MQAVIDAGAGMINDILALRTRGALEAVAASKVAACLMHMQGEPRTMQSEPQLRATWSREVHEFLRASGRDACEAAGIGRDRLVIDPGFGFGKALAA